jgi:hypothetical protein
MIPPLPHSAPPCIQSIASAMHNTRESWTVSQHQQSAPGSQRKPLPFPLCVAALEGLPKSYPYLLPVPLGPDLFAANGSTCTAGHSHH